MKKTETVDFAELSDGSLVEVIEDSRDATQTLFAVYRDKSIRYTDSVPDGGRILVPPSKTHNGLEHLRLAQGASDCGEMPDILSKVSDILGACLDVELRTRHLMAAFAVSTWFSEKLPVAPYLALVGPPGSGKTTAMRALNLVCYRSLLATDISSSAFYDISNRFRPTILLDETLTAGRPRELIHLLKASSTPDFASLRKDNVRLAYGPKVFSWLELPDDSALNSRCIIVPMRRTSCTDLKNPRDPEVLERAKFMRARLLQFRFERLRDIPVAKLPLDVGLAARPLDLYRALALPFAEDKHICAVLAEMIVEQEALQAHVLSPAQAATMRVLYHVIHADPNAPYYWLGELTDAVNSDLKSRGEPHGLSERKVGPILTSLSFKDRHRLNKGTILSLDRSDRTRIHSSMRDFKLEAPYGDSIDICPICSPSRAPAPTTLAAETRCSVDLD